MFRKVYCAGVMCRCLFSIKIVRAGHNKIPMQITDLKRCRITLKRGPIDQKYFFYNILQWCLVHLIDKFCYTAERKEIFF
jgi:hypothetical protein